MNYEKCSIFGMYKICPQVYKDQRGEFFRYYDHKLLKKHNLNHNLLQASIAHNNQKNILRGLHYQGSPKREDKLISCISGEVFDVVVDLRKDSDTYGEFEINILSDDKQILYVPAGCAHGYMTISETSTMLYHSTCEYSQELYTGIYWNSEDLNIPWPCTNPIITDKDKLLPHFHKEYSFA